MSQLLAFGESSAAPATRVDGAPAIGYPGASPADASRPVAGSSASRLFTLWSGAPLGYVERLCIASMLEAGHSLDLFTYDAALDAPEGVTVRDARAILQPRAELERSEQWALISDIFRYEGLLMEVGIWTDLDILFLKSLDGIGDYVLGWQDGWTINGALLRLPPGSSCLRKLIELCRSPVVVAPQWGRMRRARQRLLALVGMHTPVERLEWGVVGPLAITRVVQDQRMLHRCQPIDVFYPLHWQQAHLVFDPDASLVERTLTSSTRAVHLWNARIEELKQRPPPGSFIDQMCRRFRIEIPM
jgi:hypothetical protein